MKASFFYRSHNQDQLLHPGVLRYRRAILRYTREVLKDDEGKHGDSTTRSLFPPSKKGKAMIVSREHGILAGEREITWWLGQDAKKCKIKFFYKDGQIIKKNTRVAAFHGTLQDMLRFERVILNFLGRMSGIATFTHRLVHKVRAINPHILICPTRKTLWGLLDKHACAVGGGGTHRLGLFDALLIKDNHRAALKGDIEGALRSVFPLKGKVTFVAIEVEAIREALRAAKIFRLLQKKYGRIPFFILLDNMSPKKVKRNVELLEQKGLREGLGIEASGGINEHNIEHFAKTGVDIISLGALTHSAPFLDFSLEVISR